MSFKNLEQRYNEKVNSLYAGATNKFPNGKSSTGRTDEPYITRKIGDRYATSLESRSLPLGSTVQDVKRLTLFSISSRGLLFLGKQQLLQTGNTFQQTRLLNPLFVIGNAVPFLHLRRNLRPLTSLLSKTDTSTQNVKKLGQLQVETYNSFSVGGSKTNILTKIVSPAIRAFSAINAPVNVGVLGWKRSRPELGMFELDYYLRKILKTGNYKFKYGGSLFTDDGDDYNTFSKFTGNTLTLGKISFSPDGKFPRRLRYGVDSSSPFYKTYVINKTSRIRTEDAVKGSIEELYSSRKLESTGKTAKNSVKDSANKFIDLKTAWYGENGGSGPLPFLKYYTGDPESLTDSSQLDVSYINTTNAKKLAEDRVDKSKKISYIKDPSNNVANQFDVMQTKGKIPYKFINNNFSDAINVSFAMGNDDPVIFRAYLKDLNEYASPTYSENQYIGRNEKFVTYVGTRRELSFKLGILAFSDTEVEMVWRRINYLTGLVFPYSFNRGIYQPNIVRLSIGGIYLDQPGYVTSLEKNFNALAESWDLDRQVPISAEMDIKFTIIEKAARVADSPFYAITEEMEGFSKTIRSSNEAIPPNERLTGAPSITNIPLGAPNDPALQVSPDSIRNRFTPPRSLIG